MPLDWMELLNLYENYILYIYLRVKAEKVIKKSATVDEPKPGAIWIT